MPDESANLSIDSTVPLLDGHSIPRLGFGVYLSKDPYNSTLNALTKGKFRHIDCAVLYKSEREVGQAIRDSGLDRRDIFVTTKLQVPAKDGNILRQVREAVDRFGLDYVDLFLIHDPSQGRAARMAIWKALLQLKKEGKTRSIGVSNYNIHHLEELAEISDELPACNQLELHPWCAYKNVVAYCRAKGIAVEAYCPLAGGKYWNDPTLKRIAAAYDRDPAQILLRWGLQKDFIVLTKSDTASRIVSNTQIFDFTLAKEDEKALDALDGNHWTCWDVIEAA